MLQRQKQPTLTTWATWLVLNTHPLCRWRCQISQFLPPFCACNRHNCSNCHYLRFNKLFGHESWEQLARCSLLGSFAMHKRRRTTKRPLCIPKGSHSPTVTRRCVCHTHTQTHTDLHRHSCLVLTEESMTRYGFGFGFGFSFVCMPWHLVLLPLC